MSVMEQLMPQIIVMQNQSQQLQRQMAQAMQQQTTTTPQQQQQPQHNNGRFTDACGLGGPLVFNSDDALRGSSLPSGRPEFLGFLGLSR